ncbi:hypothetical protein KCU86_g9531, partial [Aureobasidium melanogenum]
MTAPSSHTQGSTRVTVLLQVDSPKGAPSTGPTSRTLVIPEHEPVLIGRASLTKNRDPAPDNALFTCAVMSRSHATLYAPNGPYGSIYLEDTGSMHGVYVNGVKISRTAIRPLDSITFGSRVTRAEGTHDGVKLTVNNITRAGATFSNPIDLCESSKTMPPASYRVPDYETDSSKDDSINTTFENSAAVEYIDLEPVSSPNRSHNFVHSEDEHDTQVYYNDSDSEFDSDCEASDYPENPDEFEYDEQSHAGSDGSRSPGSSVAEEEDDTQRDQVDSEIDNILDIHEEPEITPVHVTHTETAQAEATYTQSEEKEKAREAAEIMSLPWILEPSDCWNMSAVTLTPNSIMPKVPSPSTLKDTELPPISQSKKNVDDAGAAAQGTEKDIESQDASLKAQQSDKELESIQTPKVDKEKEVSVPTPTVDELFAKVDSPTGSKRKREIDDDGHEDVPAPSADRKLLKLKFNKQHIFKDFFKGQPQTASRPAKRAKRSTTKFALGAFAGAIGGVATVVGVLMTPQCEQLLANWPIS